MGHPRSGRSGHSLLGTSSDPFLRAAPAAAGDGGGVSSLPPATPPGSTTGDDRENVDSPRGIETSHLPQEEPLVGRPGPSLTVMPLGRRWRSVGSLTSSAPSSSFASSSPSSTSTSSSASRSNMSSTLQPSDATLRALRNVKKSLALSTSLNYALHTEKITEIPQKHPYLPSPPDDSLYTASHHPPYLRKSRALQQVGDAPLIRPGLENDSQGTSTSKFLEEEGSTTTTTPRKSIPHIIPDLKATNTTTTIDQNPGTPLPHTTTDTSTRDQEESEIPPLPLPSSTTTTTTVNKLDKLLSNTRTTPTTTIREKVEKRPLPQTTTVPTTTSGSPTKELRRWRLRTQRSAVSQDRLIQPPIDPSTVCSSNPCGVEPMCHPDSQRPRGFVCLCEDKSMVEPEASCPVKPASQHPPPNPFPKEMDPVRLVWPMGVAFVLVVALMLLVLWRRKSLCAWMKHRQREKKPSHQSEDTIPKSNSLTSYNLASNPNYYTEGPDIQTVHSLPVHFIHPTQIAFIGELGEGCFGKVYKGTYTQILSENITEIGGTTNNAEGDRRGRGGRRNIDSIEHGGEINESEDKEEEGETVTQTVAVKVIKESVSAKGEEDFMREVEIMSAFSHPNILTLVGIVAKGDGAVPWMVFEFMPYGDLAELLRSCGPHFYSNHTPLTSLTSNDLLYISLQIASGMEYLSSQHFVHRDLACRNCLVGENLTVKISDFGMSRDVYTCDYYKVGGSRMLPVRWMAPESIMYGKFTLESDVWSFGVVLWEIYSFGKQPYYGNSNENVVKLIFQGILLSPPDTCPPQVCDVMRRCWASDPADRLKFPEILSHLRVLQGEDKGCVPHNPCPQPSFSPCGTPVTYSQLCLQEEAAAGHLDQDLYLMPRRVEHNRGYMTVLNIV